MCVVQVTGSGPIETVIVCVVRNLNAFSYRIFVSSDYFSTVLHIHHIVFCDLVEEYISH